MSNISVPKNSDQAPNIFPVPSFINAEAPASAKFNQLGQHINTEFGVLSLATGNTFLHGISNLGGAVGNMKLLTPQSVANSNNLIGVKPAIFDGSNTLFNEMPAIVGAIGGDGLYPITMVIGQLGAANIIQNPDLSFTIVNVAIVTKDGSGNINEVFPGTFTPVLGYVSGPLAQFKASFGDLIIPGSNYYVVAVNASVVGVLAQAVTNIGDLQYGRITGYMDLNDVIQTLAGLPTMTAEMNATENKGFVTRWHARLLANGGVVSGPNRVWTTTTGATTFQAGSLPAPLSARAYITNGLPPYTPASAGVQLSASINGAPLTSNAGVIVSPTVTYDGATLSISLTTASIANVPGAATIDVYFPMLVPFKLLLSKTLAFGDDGSRVDDMMKTVVGQQYGWTQPTYPATIANRLDTNEANIVSLNSNFSSLAGAVVLNGSFEVPKVSPANEPDKWTFTAINGGTVSLDSTAGNFIHGIQAVKFTVGNSGILTGGGIIESTDFIPATQQTAYYVKFKTKSSIAAAINSVTIKFYDNNRSPLGSPVVIWSNSATNPTTWTCFYGAVTGDQIPVNTAFIKIKIIGGDAATTLGTTVWFDDVQFFVPGHSGLLKLFNSAGTYDFWTGANTTMVNVTLVGGGGAGGNTPSGDAFNHGGAGGGAGGCIKAQLRVGPDTKYQVIVGAGGNATSGNGGNGGTSAYNLANATPLLRAFGGNGGGDRNAAGAGGGGADMPVGFPDNINIINIAGGASGSAYGLFTGTGGSGGSININLNPVVHGAGGVGATNVNPGQGAGSGGFPGGAGGGAAGGPYNYFSAGGAQGMVFIEY